MYTCVYIYIERERDYTHCSYHKNIRLLLRRTASCYPGCKTPRALQKSFRGTRINGANK